MGDDLSTYFSGERLYGDDFTIEEIREWFMDEAEAYASLGARERDRYQYVYHALNEYHAFRLVGRMRFQEALGMGSAYGDEFKPIAHNIDQIVILDPSDAFADVTEVFGTPCDYVKPRVDGTMPFQNGRFDLVTSLGAMHHIPNVSHVLGECQRCLRDGGVMLLREPIVSMGDWRHPRKGLTKRERGIPLGILTDLVQSSGFTIRQRSLCVFPLIPKFATRLGIAAYNHHSITRLDAFLSRLFSPNVKYHRTSLSDRFAPASVYFVLEK